MNRDDDLWQQVTKDIQPLPDRKKVKAAAPAKRAKARPAQRQDSATPPPEAPPDNFRAGLDRRTAEKFRRGQMALEGRIDLHGLTQEEAHGSLRRFILQSFADGRRCLLVITGKGTGGKPGILRARVPEWLYDPPLGDVVLQVCPAQARHGGAGAVYVLLRRKK